MARRLAEVPGSRNSRMRLPMRGRSGVKAMRAAPVVRVSRMVRRGVVGWFLR